MNTTTRSLIFAAVSAAALIVNTARATLEVGKPAPDFTLTDTAGKAHKLSDYKGKTIVLEWVNPGCPIVQKHYNSQNMQNTQKVAAADGAVWFSINSASYKGAQGDLNNEEAAAWQKQMGAVTTGYLRDQTGKVGHLYDAKATPHMFVIDKNGILVYNGAIDSIDSARESDIARATNYVKAALGSLKAGTPIVKPASQPYGCNVKYGSDS